MSDLQCKPALYLYDLPDGYHRIGNASGFRVPLPGALPAATRLFATVVYGTGAVLFERGIRHSCITRDPAKADLFFIPAFTDHIPSARPLCAEPVGSSRNCSRHALLHRLASVKVPNGTSYLRRHHGRDHILPTGHQLCFPTIGQWPFFEFSVADKWLEATTILTVEEDDRSVYPWPAKHRTDRRFASIPWSSAVRMPAATPWSQLPWRQTHTRDRLVCGAFGFRGHSKALTYPLRAGLYNGCTRHPPSKCVYFQPAGGRQDNSAASRRLDETARIAELYYSSTFCLQPLGDGPSRAGMIDAVCAASPEANPRPTCFTEELLFVGASHALATL
jgi:hypothetical protein